MKEIVGNHEYKEPYTINSAQSSLKSHFLWVTLYNQAVYTGWVWGMGDMDSGGEQGFIVDLGSAKQKVKTICLDFLKIFYPGFPTQVDFTLRNCKPCKLLKCAQLRIIPRNSRTVARNGIAIGNPNFMTALFICQHII